MKSKGYRDRISTYRAYRQRSGSMRKPMVTDWIQAMSVFFGIIIWVWQYVVHDRALQLDRRQAVQDLIIAGQSDAIIDSSKAIAKRIAQKNVDYSDWQLRTDLIPFHAHLDAWAFCYRHRICESQLVLEHTCEDAVNFDKLAKRMRASSDGKFFSSLGGPLEEMIAICKKRAGDGVSRGLDDAR